MVRRRNEWIVPSLVGGAKLYSEDAVHQTNIIERAYQVASKSETLDQVRKQLSEEGYLQVEAHLGGPKIRSDLRKLLQKN